MKEELIAIEHTIKLASLIAGKPVSSKDELEIKNPYNGKLVGTVMKANADDTRLAIELALKGGKVLNRYERYSILEKTRLLLIIAKKTLHN